LIYELNQILSYINKTLINIHVKDEFIKMQLLLKVIYLKLQQNIVIALRKLYIISQIIFCFVFCNSFQDVYIFLTDIGFFG